jgi:hypothetical protein
VAALHLATQAVWWSGVGFWGFRRLLGWCAWGLCCPWEHRMEQSGRGGIRYDGRRQCDLHEQHSGGECCMYAWEGVDEHMSCLWVTFVSTAICCCWCGITSCQAYVAMAAAVTSPCCILEW